MKISRFLKNAIVQSLESFPAVYIAGSRQCGKTTLARSIAATRSKMAYVTFDDIQMRLAAQQDPNAFLRAFEESVVLDEVQLVPELFRPLKMLIDENRHKSHNGRGKFLLTGSANIMSLPQLSDALVGRMALHTLMPFSVAETCQSGQTNFIDDAFSKDWKLKQLPKVNLIQIMVKASFPELFALKQHALQYKWCNGYINTLMQRDIRALMEVEKIAMLPNLLRLLAARTSGLLNEAGLARDASLNHLTIKRYRLLLESLFLTLSIPAWSSNLGKRLIKASKVYISDLNILAYLLNINLQDLPQINPMLFGQVLENFVAIELTKQLTYSDIHARLYHYRTASGQEVDFILEGIQNHIVGIEVKARSQVSPKDFQHLETLKQEIGEKFRRGFVFYSGTDIVPFGENMWAIPFSALWLSV